MKSHLDFCTSIHRSIRGHMESEMLQWKINFYRRTSWRPAAIRVYLDSYVDRLHSTNMNIPVDRESRKVSRNSQVWSAGFGDRAIGRNGPHATIRLLDKASDDNLGPEQPCPAEKADLETTVVQPPAGLTIWTVIVRGPVRRPLRNQSPTRLNRVLGSRCI
jgi:hypothetical protein